MTNPLELANRMEAGEGVKPDTFLKSIGCKEVEVPHPSIPKGVTMVWEAPNGHQFPTHTCCKAWTYDNLQRLHDLFPHVLPGWDWGKEANEIWLFPSDQLRPAKYGTHPNPAIAFAIAMLRAVGEKE